MIKCVSIQNNHLFVGNPLLEQHRLRFNEISQKLNWDVPDHDGMEFDEYDTVATSYLLWSKPNSPVQVMCRMHPTSFPYMLKDHFNFLNEDSPLPSDPKIYEGTRMVADSNLSREERREAINEIVVGFIEFGNDNDLKGFLGVMPPKIWASTFQRAGWDIEWMGAEKKLLECDSTVRAAFYPVSEEVESKIRDTTGIHHSILEYGEVKSRPLKTASLRLV